MRVKHSIKNVTYSVIGQFINILATFAVRTIFIHTLGVAYLGINGLFTNILSMLSVAELGFGTAMTVALYKPIANGDNQMIKSIMKYYSKMYSYIGLFILGSGLCLLPFVTYLIKDISKLQGLNVYVIFLLYLVGTTSTYFFAYKRAIIIAYQQNYVVTRLHYIVLIVMVTCQATTLLIFKNFYVFLALQIGFAYIENIIVSKLAEKKYPIITHKDVDELSPEFKKKIFSDIKALSIYRISGMVLNGSSSVIISTFIGIVWVGIYSNYLLVIHALSTIIGQVMNSLTASIGNMDATQSNEYKQQVYYRLFFVNWSVVFFGSVVLYQVINRFILLWIGETFLLDAPIVMLIILNFYLLGLQQNNTVFRNGMGLFVKGKYRPVFSAFINIILGIIFAIHFGIIGVLIGTTAGMMIVILYDPYVLYKYGFKSSIKPYYKKYIEYFLLTLATVAANELLCSLLPEGNYFWLITRTIVSSIVALTIWSSVFCRTQEFKYFTHILFQMLKK